MLACFGILYQKVLTAATIHPRIHGFTLLSDFPSHLPNATPGQKLKSPYDARRPLTNLVLGCCVLLVSLRLNVFRCRGFE